MLVKSATIANPTNPVMSIADAWGAGWLIVQLISAISPALLAPLRMPVKIAIATIHPDDRSRKEIRVIENQGLDAETADRVGRFFCGIRLTNFSAISDKVGNSVGRSRRASKALIRCAFSWRQVVSTCSKVRS